MGMTMQNIDEDRMATAYHEAGHIVGYWLYFGNIDRVVEVSLGSDETGDARKHGSVLFEEYDKSQYDIGTEEGYRFWLGYAVWVAGGPMMKYRYIKERSLALGVGALLDVANLTFALQQYQGIEDDSVVENLLEMAKEWLKPRLAQHMDLAKRLAEELYRKGRLTKNEILGIFAQ